MERQFKKILMLSFVMLIVISVLASCGIGNQSNAGGSCKISFNNLKGATVPEINQYDSAVGISPDDMPKPEVTGWNFLGWYTASIGGELVDYIPAGSTSNYTLFAHWEAIPYTITYVDAPSNPNPTTYTIDDEIILADPEWSGLSFSHWQDANGNKVTSIPKGSIGNIELTAYWNYMENLVVPSGDESFIAIYDEELERYHFIVNLGTINNVVLGELGNARGKHYGQELDWEISETVGFEESAAKEVAKVITKSVTSSTEWSNTTNWAKDVSVNVEGNISAGIATDHFGFKTKLEASIGLSKHEGITWGDTTYNGGGTEDSEETTDSTSTTVAFVKNKSTTIKISTKTSSEMPAGDYKYVYTGNVHVYAVVTYDPKSENYHLDIYSYLENSISERLLYTPDANNNAHIAHKSVMDYAVDKEAISDFIGSSYYVKYDANEGDGKMPLTILSEGQEAPLQTNTFKKTGYHFIGWKLVRGDTVANFTDGQVVKDIATCGETITLVAQWAPNDNYTVVYHSNDGTDTTTESIHTYDVLQPLVENTFIRKGWIFKGWSTSPDGAVAYHDKDMIFHLPGDMEDVVNLYAVWELITSWSNGFGNLNVTDTNIQIAICYISDVFDLAQLRSNDKTMRVTVSFTIVEKYDGYQYQDFAISTGNSYNEATDFFKEKLETGGGGAPSTESYSFVAYTKNYQNTVYAYYTAHGSSDDYTVTNLHITIDFI